MSGIKEGYKPTMQEELYEIIYNLIKGKPGIGAVELVVETVKQVSETKTYPVFTHDDFQFALEGLMMFNRIREVEYTNPEIPYRIKSRFYVVQ